MNFILLLLKGIKKPKPNSTKQQAISSNVWCLLFSIVFYHLSFFSHTNAFFLFILLLWRVFCHNFFFHFVSCCHTSLLHVHHQQFFVSIFSSFSVLVIVQLLPRHYFLPLLSCKSFSRSNIQDKNTNHIWKLHFPFQKKATLWYSQWNVWFQLGLGNFNLQSRML